MISLLLHETKAQGAEVECNNNDIVQVTGYNWLLCHIRKISYYIIISYLHGIKHVGIIIIIQRTEEAQVN